MAQDVHAAFGPGYDDKTIGTGDADGVALATIQGLHQLVKEKDAEIAELNDRLATQQRQNTDVLTRLGALESAITVMADKSEVER